MIPDNIVCAALKKRGRNNFQDNQMTTTPKTTVIFCIFFFFFYSRIHLAVILLFLFYPISLNGSESCLRPTFFPSGKASSH